MVLTVSVIYGCLARNLDRNNDGLRDSFLGITKSLVPVIVLVVWEWEGQQLPWKFLAVICCHEPTGCAMPSIQAH